MVWRDCFIDGWHIPSTGEAARRYYSAWQLKTQGTPHVASGIQPWSKFGIFFDFSDISNIMPRPDNNHLSGFSLKATLEQFVHFPLKSNEGQPRFLLVTVDVQTGDAITFDSYTEKAKYHNDTDSFINNKKGIEIASTYLQVELSRTSLTIQSLKLKTKTLKVPKRKDEFFGMAGLEATHH
jgi:hypothetical protein